MSHWRRFRDQGAFKGAPLLARYGAKLIRCRRVQTYLDLQVAAPAAEPPDASDLLAYAREQLAARWAELNEFFGLNSNAADIWMPRAKAHIAREFAIRADDPQRRRDWGWSGVRSGFGYNSKAPRWVQRSGLEWSFRMAVEPRRLFRRYLFVVPSVSLLHGRDVHQ